MPSAVYQGPSSDTLETSSTKSNTNPDQDPYAAAKALNIYRQIPKHAFSHVNAREIVQRILKSRDLYEARQRAKGVKAEAEAEARRREVEDEQR